MDERLHPSPRKVTSESLRTTEALHLLLSLLRFIIPYFSIIFDLKIVRKNQNSFRRNCSITSQILTIHQIFERLWIKKLEATLQSVGFSKTLDSILRGKMEQILFVYGLPKEIVTAIMMLYKNTNAMGGLPDGDTSFCNTVTGVLQGDRLVPYLFILCQDYVLETSIDLMKENGFTF